MEGPSLVIACEEFSQFLKSKVTTATGTAKLPYKQIKGAVFQDVQSWGKHFLLRFDDLQLRVHFLMFGSYRINDPRENRIPKMTLGFGKTKIYFYSCAIKILDEDFSEIYDWSNDVMSNEWDAKKALQKIRKHPTAMVCDLLMEQDIFAGVGNIIKNEVLFNLKLHPEEKIENLSAKQQRDLVKEASAYSHQFYAWKKKNVLKKNWQVFRKRQCPLCDGAITKAPTGKGQRLSHFCKHCQKPLQLTR